MKKGLLFLSIYLCLQTARAQEPELVLPIGHTKAIIAAIFSSNNNYITTASEDNSIITWDLHSGKIIYHLQFENQITSLQISPDGKRGLATFYGQQAPILWDILTGTAINKLFYKKPDFISLEGGVKYGAFSPDGKLIVTSSIQGYPQIWDGITGNFLFELKEIVAGFDYVEFDKSGKFLLSSDYAGQKITVWDLGLRKAMKSFTPGNYFLFPAHFDPGGRYVVSPGAPSKVWDLRSGEKIIEVPESIHADFSYDGKYLMFRKYNEIKIWDTESKKELHTSAYYNGVDRYLAKFSYDGKDYLSIKRDKPVILSTETGEIVKELADNNTGSVYLNEFSPDGKLLCTAYSSNNIIISDTHTGKVIRNLKPGFSNVSNIALLAGHDKLLIAKNDGSISIFDLMNANIQDGFTTALPRATKIAGSNDSFFITTAFNTAILWDVKNQKQKLAFTGANHYQIDQAAVSSNWKYLVTAGPSLNHKEQIAIWDIGSGSLLRSLSVKTDYSLKMALNPQNDQLVIAGGMDNSCTVFDIVTGKLVAQLNFSSNYIDKIQFSPTGKYLLIKDIGGHINIWDTQKWSSIQNFSNEYYVTAFFSSDEKEIFTSPSYENSNMMEISSKEKKWQFGGNRDDRRIIAVSSKYVATLSKSNIMDFYAVGDKSPYASLAIKTGADVDFVDFEKKRVFAHLNAAVIVYDISAAEELCTIIAQDNNNYLVKTFNNSYTVSNQTAKELSWKLADRIYDFDQFDVKYNRPDIVLCKLGCPDTALITAYKKAYAKRISKLGIDSTIFKGPYSVPVADFKDRGNIEYEQKQNMIHLHIYGSDSTHHLDRYNVWVNQVPVYGVRGISLNKAGSNNLDVTVPIELSVGENQVETSVVNSGGIESYHVPLYLKYTPDKPVDSMFYFIGIGIDKFADKDYDLHWSVKDVRELALKFKEKYSSSCTIDTLFNEHVNIKEVIALKKKLLKTGVNDKVVLAYSGHGLLTKDYDYYLSSYNVNFRQPDKNGLPYDLLENLLDSIPARKKLMLIDACHSGELDKDEMVKYTKAKGALMNNNVTGYMPRGVGVQVTSKSGMSMQSSFELMRQLFVNVEKSNGATVISAAGGMQYALEKSDLKNGVFTYSILENMQENPHQNITELKKYVSQRVTELTAGLQVPTTRNETELVDWQVW